MSLPPVSPEIPAVPNPSVLVGFVIAAVVFELALFVALGWAV